MINFSLISEEKKIFDENYFLDPDYLLDKKTQDHISLYFKLTLTSQKDKDDVKEMQRKLRMLKVCAKNHTSNFKDAAELIGDKINNSKALMSAFTKYDLNKTRRGDFFAFKYRQVILVDDSVYKDLISPVLKKLEQVPAIEYDFFSEQISRLNLVEAIRSINIFSKKWIEVPQGEYKIQEGAGSSSSIYLTYWLAECVGIAISSSDKSKIAFGHLDKKAIEDGKLEEMLKPFPEEIKKNCSISIVSSFYSKNLENVCWTLAKKKFKITKIDVNPAYYDVNEGHVYMSFQSLNSSYSEILGMDVEKFLKSKSSYFSAPKIMMFDFSSGEYYLPYQGENKTFNSSQRLQEMLEKFDEIRSDLKINK